jgi:GntR family transcriptional regulator/MocR family aminotransferase
MLWQLGNDGPLYRRVYDALRTAILDGRLPVHARLPGTRALAQALGVSRIVVLAAYEQLVAEGYVVATIGSGSRVAVQVPSLAAGVPRAKGNVEHRQVRVSPYARRAQLLSPLEAPGQQKSLARQVVDFRYTATAPDARTVQLWRQTLMRAAGRPRFDYPDPSGLAQLRLALSGYLRDQRGVVAAADDLLIVNGAQKGLDLTARVPCEPNVPVGIGRSALPRHAPNTACHRCNARAVRGRS